jgi:cullin 3
MSADKSKKFVIKPFKPRNNMDLAAAQGIWGSLSRAIAEIHDKNASALSFEELYRNAYNLVLHKHGELLYNGVRGSVQAHLASVATTMAVCPDEQLLQELSARWGDHQVTMVMIRDILMYMDRTYVTQQKKTAVYDLGLQIFRDSIARHDKVCVYMCILRMT